MDLSFKPLKLADLRFGETTEAALKNDRVLGTKIASIARDLHLLREESREVQAGLLDYYGDKTAGYKLGTASWMAASKKCLAEATTPAGVLLVAARNVLGPGMTAWEPDTIRMELEDREKINVPPVNWDKLFAAVTLTEVPAFYFEVLTFQNTILAFNHEAVDIDVVQEATPAQIAWGVYEAELIRHENMLHEPSFDYEPILYTANVLHRAGMILAPDVLAFAQDALDDLNKDNGTDVGEVRKAWKELPPQSLASRTFTESVIDIQLAKLAAVHIYVNAHADAYTKALVELRRA